jgi:UDPglucose--hexose-1-phosphate uridylyltransferase
MIADELRAGERIVAMTRSFVAMCPYASRFPFEVWIVPREQRAKFESVEDGELGELSLLVRDAVGRIERAVGLTPYNYFLHTLPFDIPANDHYHWHIEIFPRLTKVAGFEWGTGCFINPYPPELAAARLRAALA